MKKIIVLVIGSLILFSACRKEIVKKAIKPDKITSMDELNVSSDFNWKTTKDYQITFTATNSNLVKVTNENGDVFQSAFLKANEPYKMKLNLPSFQKSVHLKFLNDDVVLKLDNSQLEYQFN